MGFVDDNLTEVMNRGEECGTRADNNEWAIYRAIMDFEPGFAALDHGEIRVHNDNALAKSFLKDAHELASESDFGNKQNSGFLSF